MRNRNTYSELSDLPFFRGWTKDELSQIDRVAERVSYVPGEALIRENRTGLEFIVVLEGEIDVSVGGTNVATLGPGDHVGEMALLDGTRTSATVTAVTPVKALLVGSREFQALLQQVPTLDRKLLVSLTRRLREPASS